jgi:hypothetical protein
MLKTAAYFLAGALVTSAFSASLYMLTANTSWIEVLVVGMVVPSFTWVVQLIASTCWLPTAARERYHNALARVCLLGSVALLPAAVANVALAHPSLWLSAVNVLFSVAAMAVDLFRRSRHDQLSVAWPVSFCLTIVLNMALFVWSSYAWWPSN